ncbi:hypothetical protein Tco_1325321 [Tanacetum coccineum]
MIKRFTVVDDLKESSKITQVKGTMLKDHYLPYKDNLLSEAALLEAAQLKKTLKKSKLETHKLHASGSGTSTKLGVLDVPKYQSESKNESWGDSKDDDRNEDVTNDVNDDVDSDADDENEASDSEKTNSDEDDNLNLNQNEDEEEEYEEYQFLNLDNILPTDTEVISKMNVKVRHEEPSTQTPPLLTDEVIPAFGRHLEEIHVTWAHLEKKQTRLRTYTNISQEFLLRSWRRRHRLHVTPSQTPSQNG